MAHNIEGQNFVAGRNNPAWHGLGTVVDGTMTTEQVLEASNLAGWDVRLDPLVVSLGNGNTDTVTDKYAVIRQHPNEDREDVLAVVGKRYEVISAEELFKFGTDVIGIEGQWDTAGSLDEGRRVFGAALLPRSFTLDPSGSADTVQQYLTVATSFDGTLQTRILSTPVRVVCQNTLTMAINNSQRIFNVRHTKNADERLAKARKALDLTHEHFGAWEQAAKELFEVDMSDKQFQSIIDLYDAVPDERIDDEGEVKNRTGITRAENRQGLYWDVLRAGTNANIAGTAWAGLQALVEVEDYYREVRGDADGTRHAVDALSLNGQTKGKDNALGIVREVVLA